MACLVVLLLCVLATAKTSSIADSILRNNPYPSVNASNVREFARYLTSELKNTVFESEHTGVNAPFPCNSSGRSVPTPTDARKLKPADVDVVITLGDSVAAGFGALATSIFGVFTEYRGHTFCNGGEPNYDTYVTVPNILKIYNPNLKGYSIGTGGAGSKNAKLNVAVSGARSYDLSSQYEMLLNQLTSEGIAPTDWKVITIFVGGNDLCDYCSDTTKNSPANWKKNMELIVDLIMANIPRVFLNLVAPPDVTLLGQVSEGFCSLLHGFECGCATDASTHTAHKEYTAALESLIELPKYQTKEDFYVTLQPFLKDMVLPSIDGKPDRSYFAPDCFHFSGKAHEAAAVALWNNMVEEKAKKKTSWVPGEPLECSEGFLM